MIRLSIIVPFYNVEKYIEQCIRSLYDQDIPQEEYEVICVDDCSPDGSRAIVEQLQKEYPTLQLICHTENKRQGGARNTGLAAAKGEYIWFVDSDDYVMPNVFSQLLTRAENDNLDILHFNIATDNNGVIEPIIGGDYPKDIVVGKSLFLNKGTIWYLHHITAWQKLYKRDFLLKEDLQFAEHVFSEDDDYSFVAYAKAKKTRHLDLVGYVYRTNNASTIHNKVNPIYVYSEIKQIFRFSCIFKELTSIDVQYKDAIMGDVRDAIVQVNRQLPQLTKVQKRIVRQNINLKELVEISKLVSIPTYLLFLKRLYL